MRITEIDDNNERFFDAVIGERYGKRKGTETFLGLVDDEDLAVGAAVVEADGADLMLSYIGIAENRQRQGLGSFFIKSIIESIDDNLYDGLQVILFLKNGEEKGPVPQFLIKNGFSCRKIDGRRTVYDLNAVIKGKDLTADRQYDKGKIVEPGAVTEKLKKKLRETEEGLEMNAGAYFSADRIVSKDNEFGGIYVKGEEIMAALCAVPFADGVRVESIYAAQDGSDGLYELIEHAKARVSKSGVFSGNLYIDTIGSVLMRFEDAKMGYMGVKPVEAFEAFVFERGKNE
ncbi:MAG: hypothetical protein K6E19_10790 [Lachnospiraceae bacterium]|nr:hypothetical protein [Lachnospiraceae bacterium]